MRLMYLTNVILSGEDAQSLQIGAMCRSFAKFLKGDFVLVSPKPNIASDCAVFSWKKISINQNHPRLLRQFFFILKSFFEVKKFKPQIIYTRDIAIAGIYKIFGYQTIYEIHKPFETKIGNFLFKIFGRKIKLVAISAALKNFIIQEYNLSEEKILVVHDGVFFNDYEKLNFNREEFRKKMEWKKEDFVVFYAGSLQKGKGLELIEGAAEKISQIKFIVIGGKEKKERKNILFLPRVPQGDLIFYFKAADLLAVPFTKNLKTWKYHSPLKIFEYMASGVPIVASAIGSVLEVLNDSNSFLFDPEKSDDFEEKILLAKNNRLEAEKMAKKAKEDVKKYDWQERVLKIFDFINF